jgi:hypothetical protein
MNARGEPIVGHYPNVEMVVTPGASRYDPDSARIGTLAADADFISNVDRANNASLKTDDQGYVTLPALIPGASYRLNATRGGRNQIVKEFQVKADETLDLGELVVERAE